MYTQCIYIMTQSLSSALPAVIPISAKVVGPFPPGGRAAGVLAGWGAGDEANKETGQPMIDK